MGTHQVMIDRPVSKDGADMGPMGGQLFLASVGGCFMSNLLAAIRARDSNISDVRTEVIGTIADSPARFEALELFITAATTMAKQNSFLTRHSRSYAPRVFRSILQVY